MRSRSVRGLLLRFDDDVRLLWGTGDLGWRGWTSEAFVSTRRQLRGLAESLIGGPQHRAAGTIRLAVRPDGFVGVALPLAVRGTEFTWQDGSAALAGTPGALAEAAGVDYGPPEGVYEIVDPLPADAVLDIDPAAVELIDRSLYAGGYALKQVLPESHPVLWPEHFDVAVTEDEVNYGVSAGDSPRHPVRLRRTVDAPHRRLLERAVRGGVLTWTRPTTSTNWRRTPAAFFQQGRNRSR